MHLHASVTRQRGLQPVSYTHLDVYKRQSFIWWERFLKSRVRKVTEIQVHFFPFRLILVATTSHCSNKIGWICSIDTISSLKVFSTLKPLLSSGTSKTGELSIPLAYWKSWCPVFSPRSVWIVDSLSRASSPMVRIPKSTSFFSDVYKRQMPECR